MQNSSATVAETYVPRWTRRGQSTVSAFHQVMAMASFSASAPALLRVNGGRSTTSTRGRKCSSSCCTVSPRYTEVLLHTSQRRADAYARHTSQYGLASRQNNSVLSRYRTGTPAIAKYAEAVTEAKNTTSNGPQNSLLDSVLRNRKEVTLAATCVTAATLLTFPR